MRIATALRTTLLTAAIATLASGCGMLQSGEAINEGSVATTTRDIDNIVVFDPCTQINDEVLISMGLDPASKNVVTNAAEGPTSWRVCNWKPTNRLYSMGVLSTSHTLDEARKNDDLTEFHDVTVGTRRGLSFREKRDPENICHVAFSAQQGMFEIRTAWIDGDSTDGNLCDIAMNHAIAIEPRLPE